VLTTPFLEISLMDSRRARICSKALLMLLGGSPLAQAFYNEAPKVFNSFCASSMIAFIRNSAVKVD
jgi:hypothetical protein